MRRETQGSSNGFGPNRKPHAHPREANDNLCQLATSRPKYHGISSIVRSHASWPQDSEACGLRAALHVELAALRHGAAKTPGTVTSASGHERDPNAG